MTDKPKIEVGQKWVTGSGDVVRVLEVAETPHGYTHSVSVRGLGQPYCVDMNGDHEVYEAWSLVSLAPQTIKREVALYQYEDEKPGTSWETGKALQVGWRRISEPLTIEFTLLPGEST